MNEKLAFMQVFNEDTFRMILNEKKILSWKLISERTFIQSRQIDISSIGGKELILEFFNIKVLLLVMEEYMQI
jgi:hypothetical protein